MHYAYFLQAYLYYTIIIVAGITQISTLEAAQVLNFSAKLDQKCVVFFFLQTKNVRGLNFLLKNRNRLDG